MPKRCRILAVDDDPTNIEIIKRVLIEEYDVLTALNGHDAIDQLEGFKPDLILLDVMMPNLNGFEVCSIIKTDERFAAIPIIFLTALDTRAGTRQGLECGGIDYLTKPVDFDLLKLRVRNHIVLRDHNQLVLEQRDLLTQQKEEYQTLFNEMLDGFALHEMIVDAQGNSIDYRFLAVNPAFERLTGLKAEAVVGRTVLEVLPETEKHWIETYGQVARTGEPAFFENYASALNKYFEVKAFCPAPNQFACMVVDITVRKKIEETQLFLMQAVSLATGEDFFAALARYLSQALDMDYVCIDLLQGEGHAAKTLAIYSDGKFADNVEYTLKDTPCGAVVGQSICVFPREVRHLFPHDLILQELLAESYVGATLWGFDGKPIGLIAVIGRKPLQDSYLAEAILKLVSLRAAGELERQLAEAERQKLEHQFQHTQKLESLGVLAGGIAHDFNNILAIIMGSCFLAKENAATAERHIAHIEKAADRGADLCWQMLTYAGKAQPDLTQVKIRVLVEDMVKMLQTTISKNVSIAFTSPPAIPFVEGHTSQIRQVVMNLIINAAEAIGEEQGKIEVRLYPVLFAEGEINTDHLGKIIPAASYLCLEVADTGCGMDKATQQRIFEPFYTTKFTGRGLGLSAILGIIAGHKGALQLLSRPGQGTTFKVYLPVSSMEPTGEVPLQLMVSAPWQGSGTVLLVDDEESILLAVSAMLKMMGFTVIKAVNGRVALELYQEKDGAIDLVLSDMGMPDMNGYELVRELKSIKIDLPIIMTSGFGDTEAAASMAAGEIAGFLHKPYNFEQLRTLIQKVLTEGALKSPVHGQTR